MNIVTKVILGLDLQLMDTLEMGSEVVGSGPELELLLVARFMVADEVSTIGKFTVDGPLVSNEVVVGSKTVGLPAAVSV
jgi:hypothetical protein